MKELNLYKVWEILNKLSDVMDILSEEQDKYVYLLGRSSEYNKRTFNSFLEYYAFKIEGDNIIVFNDDGVPYEEYTNNDFSNFPFCLLSFTAEKLESWIGVEVGLQLESQQQEKLQEIENMKSEIARLQKEVVNFGEKV